MSLFIKACAVAFSCKTEKQLVSANNYLKLACDKEVSDLCSTPNIFCRVENIVNSYRALENLVTQKIKENKNNAKNEIT